MNRQTRRKAIFTITALIGLYLLLGLIVVPTSMSSHGPLRQQLQKIQFYLYETPFRAIGDDNFAFRSLSAYRLFLVRKNRVM